MGMEWGRALGMGGGWGESAPNQKFLSEWRSGVKDARPAWHTGCPDECEVGNSRQCDRRARVSGHKTQLYLVAASTGGPASGSRCGFCDTTYNCSCVWNPEASFMTDRNERSVICARSFRTGTFCFPRVLAELSKLFLCSAGQASINGAVSAAVLAEPQPRRCWRTATREA